MKRLHQKHDLLKGKDFSVTGDDTREGWTAVIIKMASTKLQFEGQTKGKLGNPGGRGCREPSWATRHDFFEETPTPPKTFVKRRSLSARPVRPRALAPRAHPPQGRRTGVPLPGKLGRLPKRDPAKSGNLHCGGRFGRRFGQTGPRPGLQAILPLKRERF